MSAPHTAAGIITEMEDDVLSLHDLLGVALTLAGHLEPDDGRLITRVIHIALEKAESVKDAWEAAFDAGRAKSLAPLCCPVAGSCAASRRSC